MQKNANFRLNTSVFIRRERNERMGENGRRERGKEARKERKQTVERGEREEELDRGLSRVPAGSIYRGKE